MWRGRSRAVHFRGAKFELGEGLTGARVPSASNVLSLRVLFPPRSRCDDAGGGGVVMTHRAASSAARRVPLLGCLAAMLSSHSALQLFLSLVVRPRRPVS